MIHSVSISNKDGIGDNPSKIEILKEYINRKDELGVAPIHLASYKGSLKLVKLLWANGADPFLATDEGLNVLHSASEGDAVNIIYYFINHYGMDIDKTDSKGWTPLHWSVVEGHEVAATYLLSWGAKINLADGLGNTPLHLSVHWAERELNSRLTKILLLRGASREIVNNDGKKPIEVIDESEIQKELIK